MLFRSKSISGGLRINVDLLNAQQQLYATQRDLAQARYGYLLAYLKLHDAAGRLGLDALEKIDREFQLLADFSIDKPAVACAGKGTTKCAATDSVVMLRAGLPQEQVDGGKLAESLVDAVGDEAVEWRAASPVEKAAKVVRPKAKRKK